MVTRRAAPAYKRHIPPRPVCPGRRGCAPGREAHSLTEIITRRREWPWGRRAAQSRPGIRRDAATRGCPSPATARRTRHTPASPRPPTTSLARADRKKASDVLVGLSTERLWHRRGVSSACPVRVTGRACDPHPPCVRDLAAVLFPGLCSLVVDEVDDSYSPARAAVTGSPAGDGATSADRRERVRCS
jgi:hypothetical protein